MGFNSLAWGLSEINCLNSVSLVGVSHVRSSLSASLFNSSDQFVCSFTQTSGMCQISLNPPIKKTRSVHTYGTHAVRSTFHPSMDQTHMHKQLQTRQGYCRSISGRSIDSYCCVNRTAWTFEWHVTNVQETQRNLKFDAKRQTKLTLQRRTTYKEVAQWAL
jgi:hypothetical protein